jgi:hypothetical protein
MKPGPSSPPFRSHTNPMRKRGAHTNPTRQRGTPRLRVGFVYKGILLALASWVVLGHGCHKHDVDDELAFFLARPRQVEPNDQTASSHLASPAGTDSAAGCSVANEGQRLP